MGREGGGTGGAGEAVRGAGRAGGLRAVQRRPRGLPLCQLRRLQDLQREHTEGGHGHLLRCRQAQHRGGAAVQSGGGLGADQAVCGQAGGQEGQGGRAGAAVGPGRESGPLLRAAQGQAGAGEDALPPGAPAPAGVAQAGSHGLRGGRSTRAHVRLLLPGRDGQQGGSGAGRGCGGSGRTVQPAGPALLRPGPALLAQACGARPAGGRVRQGGARPSCTRAQGRSRGGWGRRVQWWWWWWWRAQTGPVLSAAQGRGV
mmetsp:Transcript_15914/g.35220  ORF Transcript_15914/g.35220 Transcript_15914/m.35220 type:complete len:257 (+) Transcript_15914:375-1145(+)